MFGTRKRKFTPEITSRLLFEVLNSDVLFEIFSYLGVRELMHLSTLSPSLEAVVWSYFYGHRMELPYITGLKSAKYAQTPTHTWTDNERLTVCRNWTVGVPNKVHTFSYNKQYRVALDADYFYCTRRGKIRRHRRTIDNVSKEFTSVPIGDEEYLTTMAVDKGVVFGGTVSGNCYLVRKFGQKPKICEGYRKVLSVDFNWYRNVFLVSSTYKTLTVKKLRGPSFETQWLLQQSVQVCRLDRTAERFVTGDLNLELYNVESVKKIGSANTPERTVLFDVAWDDKIILAGGYDTHLLLYDTRTMEFVRRYDQKATGIQKTSVNSIQYDGQFGVLSSTRKRVNLIDLRMHNDIVASYVPSTTDRSDSRQIVADTRNLFISTENQLYHMKF